MFLPVKRSGSLCFYLSRGLVLCVLPFQSSGSLCFTCPEFWFTVFYLSRVLVHCVLLSRVLVHCVLPVQSSGSLCFTVQGSGLLCFTCTEFWFTVFYLQVAVTTSNRVYTWGCHPHNLRYAASVLRRSRQMGQLSAPVGDGMEMFHLPALVDTTFLRSQIVQVGCLCYSSVFFRCSQVVQVGCLTAVYPSGAPR